MVTRPDAQVTPAASTPAAPSRGVTLRSVLLAFALLVVFAPAGFYGELMYKSVYVFASGAPAVAPLFTLFLLTALNPHLRRFGIRPLARGELLSVYAIVIIGGPLISHGILPWLIPYQIAQRYTARVSPEWEAVYFQYIPAWFGPTDFTTAEGYYFGHAAVPWAQWWTPLAAWLSFFLALFLCPLSLVVLLRRQWITHERLSFPIAQVPLELVKERGDARSEARLPADWAFWVGLLIPFTIGVINKLARLFPAIPGIPLSGLILMQAQQTGPQAGLGAISLELSPWIVAIAYIIPKDLSFSCWFFWFLRVAMVVAAISFGATPESPEGWYGSGFPAPHHQGGGAVLALAGWTLWSARRHLGRALRLAFSRWAEGDEPGEGATYRWAILGFLITFAYMVAFCVLAGTRPVIATAMVGLIVTYYVMWARLRAETGLSFIAFPFRVDEILTAPFGNRFLRVPEIAMLYDLRWAYFPGFGDSFEVSTGNALDAFKIADSARLRLPPLLAAMGAGFLLSMAVVTYTVLTGMYHYGFQNSAFINSGWLGPQLSFIGGRIYETVTNPTSIDLNGIVAMVAGGAIAILLGVMRLRFWWWPLHPVGFLASSCWGMHTTWMPFFVGWLLKVIVTRYGGLRLYRRTLPIAIGLIVGDFVSQGVWVVVGLLTQGRV